MRAYNLIYMEKVFTAAERQNNRATGNLKPTAGSVTQSPQTKKSFLSFCCQDVVQFDCVCD